MAQSESWSVGLPYSHATKLSPRLAWIFWY